MSELIIVLITDNSGFVRLFEHAQGGSWRRFPNFCCFIVQRNACLHFTPESMTGIRNVMESPSRIKSETLFFLLQGDGNDLVL